MSQGFDQVGEYFRGFNRKQRFWVLVGLVLVLFALAYFKVVRPQVALVYKMPHIHVHNKGKSDAVIHRMDGFLFWEGKIAYVENMPKVRETVGKGLDMVLLQAPTIPLAKGFGKTNKPGYFKLIVRYQIPWFPIFRYTSLLFLKYNASDLTWEQTESIPSRYRSLGKAGVGDVDLIQLDFK
jgi:hypothetical protein